MGIILGLYSGYIGIMEKKMETTIIRQRLLLADTLALHVPLNGVL